MNTCGKCGIEMKENVKYCKTCGAQASLNDKKARVMTGEKTWMKPALIISVVVIIAAGGWIFTESRAANPMAGQAQFSPQRDIHGRTAKALAVTAQNGVIRIPAGSVDDGSAHFFAYGTSGRTITFFVMKAADGSIRTAFDACMACNHAKLGYRQEGQSVVCNNCGMAFAPEDIGKRTGGCNPIPVEKGMDGQMIVLKAKDLEAGAQYF